MAVRVRHGQGRIVLEGDERVIRSLDRVRRRLNDLRWLFGTLTELFVAKERNWFDSEAKGTWPALSPAYARWKAVAYPGRPIMVRTGDLRSTLTSGKAVLAKTDDSLFLGTSVPYAAYHARGAGNLPQRPPLIPTVSITTGLARRIEYELMRLV